MNRKKFAPLAGIVVIASLFALLNFLTLKFLLPARVYDSFHYNVFELYLIFAVISAAILSALIVLKEKYSQQLGFIFLFLTTFKLALCYLLILPILDKSVSNGNSEKINFFVIFILFLAIEVVYTSKLLKDTK